MRLLAAIFSLVLPSLAAAADLRAPVVAPAAVDSWAGAYIGAGFGMARLSSSLTTIVDCSEVTGYVCTNTLYPENGVAIGAAASGWAVGPSIVGLGFVGYNWRVEKLIASLEADLVSAPIGVEKAGSAVTSNNGLCAPGYSFPCPGHHATYWSSAAVGQDYSAELRLRLGFLVSDNVLLYGLGGIAVARDTVTNHYHDNAAVPYAYTLNTHNAAVKAGYVFGTGAEWTLAETWRVRAEYSRSGFAAVTTAGRLSAVGWNDLVNLTTSRGGLTMDKVVVGLVRKI